MPVVAAAALTAGASLYAGSQANKAANKQADLSQQTTNRIIDLQQQNAAATKQAEQPYVNGGYAGLEAYLGQLGLGAQKLDGNAYMASNPDVNAAYEAFKAGDAQWQQAYAGVNSAAEFAQRHYDNGGKDEGRVAPMLGQSSGPDLSSIGQRQSYTRPGAIGLPSMPNLDPASYQKSPGYDYQQKEGIRNLNASFGARGLLKSGAAIKGVETFAQNLADQDYQQWQGNELAKWQQQYNAAISANNLQNQTFESDRQYGTGTYDADRGYLTNNYNQQNQNLLSAANLGQNGISATNAANTAATNSIGGQLNQNANVLSDVYGQKAQTNSEIGMNLARAGGNLLSGGMTREQTPISAANYSYVPQSSAQQPWNPSNLLRAPNPVF